jgi:hypothetical protein
MTRIAASLVTILLLVLAAGTGTAQQPPPSATPTTLAVGTILADFSYFAGQLVRIPKARVRDVISPRVFTVEQSTMPHSYVDHGGRVLVVADKPGVELKRGTVVEIIGRPWTFEGARTHITGNWMEELDSDERDHFASRAVFSADIVRTPGRVEFP